MAVFAVAGPGLVLLLGKSLGQRKLTPLIWTGAIVVFWGIITVFNFTLREVFERLAHLNENNAKGVLLNIQEVEKQFKEMTGRYGTLFELAEKDLVGRPLAEGKTIWGYSFISSDVTNNTFCIHADCTKHTAGFRDCNITEIGEVRCIKSEIKETVPRGQGKDAFDYSK